MDIQIENIEGNGQICPLLSIGKEKAICCQEEKCQWYIKKSARTEVYDCAVTALAVYNLPHYRG